MREGIASRWNTCPRLQKKMCLSIPSSNLSTEQLLCNFHPWLKNFVNILYPLIAHLVKNLRAVQETPVRFLDWEDPLEKG